MRRQLSFVSDNSGRRIAKISRGAFCVRFHAIRAIGTQVIASDLACSTSIAGMVQSLSFVRRIHTDQSVDMPSNSDVEHHNSIFDVLECCLSSMLYCSLWFSQMNNESASPATVLSCLQLFGYGSRRSVRPPTRVCRDDVQVHWGDPFRCAERIPSPKGHCGSEPRCHSLK